MYHNGFCYVKYNFGKSCYLKIKKNQLAVSENCYVACVSYSQLEDSMKDSVFQKNFFKSLQNILPCKIDKLDDISFDSLKNTKISQYTCPTNNKYSFCKIDGKKYKLCNYVVEPLCIFKGRGDHPLRGTIKIPVLPESITLNLSESAPIPVCPIKNHNWGNIIHNPDVTWAGFYKDSVGKSKYMCPLIHDDSSKFEKSRNLKKKLMKVRKIISEDLESNNLRTLQKATACALIDKLCIRVGHMKEQDSADTVGTCTLRVEHFKFHKDSITLKFIGKDSIVFCKTFKPSQAVFNNLKSFVHNKTSHNEIFDQIDANSLNTYLNSLLPGLTAKMFRTCHASTKFESLLSAYCPSSDDNPTKYFKLCNLKIAKLCNHKRGIAFSTETSKANYIDPRIIFAFSKRHDIPIDNLLSKSLIKKFSWAENTGSDFRF